MALPPSLGKILIALGLLLVLIGIAVTFGKKFPLFHLPGDFAISSGSTSFYFPIVSCIILSIVLTAIIQIIGMVTRK